MSRFTLAGTAGFLLWGLLHVVGGGAILLSLSESPEAGFSFYRGAGDTQSPLAGAVLGYLAYGFAMSGLAVSTIAVMASRLNSAAGLAANSLLVVAVEVGLILFLLLPGHLGFTDALPGLILATVGIVFGGLACRGGHHAAESR